VWPEGTPDEAGVSLRRMPRTGPEPRESSDGREWRVSRAESFVADSGIPCLAVDFPKAELGIDRGGVPRGEEVAETLKAFVNTVLASCGGEA